MKIVILTAHDGKLCFVNVKFITHVIRLEFENLDVKLTRVHTTSGMFDVKETPEEILKFIAKAIA